ncbi:MAG: MBL fold metallo-hydrolase [Acidobacteriota bacterium]
MIAEIAPGIKFIKAEGKGFPYCHSLLIEDELRVIIESGAGQSAYAPFDLESIHLVLNTHYHKDHTWGNDLFPNARILMHRLDYPPMVDETSRDLYTGFFQWDEIMPIPRGPIRQNSGSTLAPFVPARVDGFFAEGEIIHFGRLKAQVLHLPGHTPGHCGFYFEREGLLFAGDIDLIPFGPHYGDYLSNLEDFRSSIAKVREINPRIYCCSHRRPITENVTEQIDSYYARTIEREDRLRELLKNPATIKDLVGKYVVYPSYEHPYFPFWEHRMIEKHLDSMMKRDEVELVEGDKYRIKSR